VNGGVYNRPVLLDVYLSDGAHALQAVTPNTDGCLVKAVVTGYYWRLRVYHDEGGYTYLGRTNWQYVVGGYHYNLGTVYLSSIRT
jgi:hypothetical protein